MFNPFPFVSTALLLLIPSLFLLKGKRAFVISAAVSATLVLLLLIWAYAPGVALRYRAEGGEPAAMYEYARWVENHNDQIGAFIIWPLMPDVLEGYSWLEKAAEHDYPPALYAVGVRLKYGQFVPKPENWEGAAGNVFQQPDRGQPFIDRAHELGFQPATSEEEFYWKEYRAW